MAAIGDNRTDGRAADQLRPVSLEVDFVDPPEGSVLISCGKTQVLCNASILNQVPRWIEDSQRAIGWITAEYAMLPRSAEKRIPRETLRPRGRSQEIKRFIGRSLRAGFNLNAIQGLTCIIDCDVLRADGGTRTASVTGGYVALALALHRRKQAGKLETDPFQAAVAAVSAGVLDGQVLLDLNYQEDSAADVDANVVMNSAGAFIEVQSTSEGTALDRTHLDGLLDMAERGIAELLRRQQEALRRAGFGPQNKERL